MRNKSKRVKSGKGKGEGKQQTLLYRFSPRRLFEEYETEVDNNNINVLNASEVLDDCSNHKFKR